MANGNPDFEHLEQEVERRVERILADDEASRKYDTNADGVIDLSEREFLKRVVAAEVYGEFLRNEEPKAGELDSLIADRFEIVRHLGSGGQGHTDLAIDRETGTEVAVKELAIGKLNDWKALELFEREAEVLQSLDHSAIPKLIDAFHVDSDSGRRFFIAQEYVEGEDLEQMLERGHRWSESEVVELMRRVLDVLEYLHGHSPQVVHRDIKPSNIIQRPDGTIALIDFGAVQNVIPKTVGGSTIVGTAGYMPIEQVMGRSVPATDLYALGATAVHLLSAKHPADLPMLKSQVQFRRAMDASPMLMNLMDDLLKPNVEERLQSVQEVRRRLRREDAQIDTDVVFPTRREIHVPKSWELSETRRDVLLEESEIYLKRFEIEHEPSRDLDGDDWTTRVSKFVIKERPGRLEIAQTDYFGMWPIVGLAAVVLTIADLTGSPAAIVFGLLAGFASFLQIRRVKHLVVDRAKNAVEVTSMWGTKTYPIDSISRFDRSRMEAKDVLKISLVDGERQLFQATESVGRFLEAKLNLAAFSPEHLVFDFHERSEDSAIALEETAHVERERS